MVALGLLAFGLLALSPGAGPTAAQAQPPAQPQPEPPAAQAPEPSPQVSTPRKRTLSRDGHGGRYLIDGTWHFRLDAEDQGLAQDFQSSQSLAGWSPVSVPNAWNATDISVASQRGTVGWYRKDFRVPRTGAKSWTFRFESVNYRARVFLNGREIGQHEGGYIPFEVPARGLRRGEVNRLVVRVDNRRGAIDLPPLSNQRLSGLPGGGWWNYGGLLREVYLREVGRVDIADLLARPRLPCRSCDASVLVRLKLRNPGRSRRTVRPRASVGGRRVPLRAVSVPARSSRRVSARVRVANPRLWEPKDPDLYRVRASAGGSTYSTHIGIRSIEVRNGILHLNGRRLKLRGAAIHEENPRVGAALTPAMRARDIRNLKRLGGNATRAHYPLHPHYLELADREGVLVWEQIPFYRIPRELVSAVIPRGLSYLRDTIARDQNHASVFAWSLQNELNPRPTSDGGQNQWVNAAIRLVKRHDPTRLTAIDFPGYPAFGPQSLYKKLDALGMNSYFGWYTGPTSQIFDRRVLSPYLDRLRRYYPKQALFVTEFGAEANRPGPVGEKGTYAFQQEFMRFHVSTYDAKPYVNGVVAWILNDFKVRPGWEGGNPKPDAPWNRKGLLDEYGREKPAFDATQRLYRRVTGRGR